VISQFVQLAGALAILAAFAAAQARRLDVSSRPYLWLNLGGSFVLAVDAWHEQQWGFLLLEAAWAVVSANGLVVRSRSASRAQASP
jgi:hypothetical protein